MLWLSRYIRCSRSALALIASLLALGGAEAQTLKKVQERGTLLCGINKNLPGFSGQDARGRWVGFDVDFCRAVAAAVLGDADKVRFIPLDVPTRFTAVQSGAVDILVRNTTWTLSRETEYGLLFPVITYYDGQGFIARKERGIVKADQLGGGRICVHAGTTHDAYAADYFESHGQRIDIVAFPAPPPLVKAYETGWCDAITGDVSALYALRRTMAAPAEHVLAETVISKEPLGPAVRQGDAQWFSIVRWTHFAMLTAEEKGITSTALASGTAPPSRFLSEDEDLFQDLGLKAGAELRIIRSVGNYAEVYERNLGSSSPLGIPRGMNRLARDGGLHYAPPIH